MKKFILVAILGLISLTATSQLKTTIKIIDEKGHYALSKPTTITIEGGQEPISYTCWGSLIYKFECGRKYTLTFEREGCLTKIVEVSTIGAIQKDYRYAFTVEMVALPEENADPLVAGGVFYDNKVGNFNFWSLISNSE